MTLDRAERNRLSAEWAAYGDALGFMTELADAGRVRHRIGSDRVDATVPWRRKIGGFNGVSVELPTGCYSDDTQLRLSTGRAIRGDGSFDVAAFAKVELPAWANYALGAGSASKEAASNLARTSATWYSNFFDSKRASYVRAGGNGAAMRVQPHIWAARDLRDPDAVLPDVIRNSVCTHGHPVGIVGACLHALTLAFALREGRPARLDEIRHLVDRLGILPALIEKDGDLRLFWVGPWTEASGTELKAAIAATLDNLRADLLALRALDDEPLAATYPAALKALDALDPESRGSGSKTALLAAFAASRTDVADPKAMLILLANALGSDTDSIATMAGAIVGACTDLECGGAIQDREYISAEAIRLAAVASGKGAESFRYPDLRSWKPARAAMDAIGLIEGRLCLAGLGALEPLEGMESTKVGADALTWCALPFGQTILARVRAAPQLLDAKSPRGATRDESAAVRSNAQSPTRLKDLFDRASEQPLAGQELLADDLGALSLNELLQRVIDSGFAPDLVGRALLQQVDAGGRDFVERGAALAATMLTAYEARKRRRGR